MSTEMDLTPVWSALGPTEDQKNTSSELCSCLLKGDLPNERLRVVFAIFFFNQEKTKGNVTVNNLMEQKIMTHFTLPLILLSP